MFNTPPVVPIYAALQTLRWIKAQGGVEEMQRRAKQRADMLYAEIDRNKLFRGTVTAKEDRYGGHQGSPFCGWFPCFLLQCHAGRKCAGTD